METCGVLIVRQSLSRLAQFLAPGLSNLTTSERLASDQRAPNSCTVGPLAFLDSTDDLFCFINLYFLRPSTVRLLVLRDLTRVD